MLLAYGGLRIGEAFALRRRSIDLAAGAVTIAQNLVEIEGSLSFDTPKSHQARTVLIPAFVVARLREHLATIDQAAAALLFTVARTGTPLHYTGWRAAYFDRAVEAAGLTDVTPHDLRASHGSWVAKRHGVMAAQARLGHAHASVTTRHYARALKGDDQAVALDLGRGHAARIRRKGHVGGTASSETRPRSRGGPVSSDPPRPDDADPRES